jgi:hypothetical protein
MQKAVGPSSSLFAGQAVGIRKENKIKRFKNYIFDTMYLP